MAHFARIDSNNLVREVCVINNDVIAGGAFPDSELLGQAFLAECGFDGTWVQCSYSGAFRGCYPGPGWTYDATLDEFVPPTPVVSDVAAAYDRGKSDGLKEAAALSVKAAPLA